MAPGTNKCNRPRGLENSGRFGSEPQAGSRGIRRQRRTHGRATPHGLPCKSFQKPRLLAFLLPEEVVRSGVEQQTEKSPDAAKDAVAEDQAEKEGDRSAVSCQAAEAHRERFECPCD